MRKVKDEPFFSRPWTINGARRVLANLQEHDRKTILRSIKMIGAQTKIKDSDIKLFMSLYQSEFLQDDLRQEIEQNITKEQIFTCYQNVLKALQHKNLENSNIDLLALRYLLAHGKETVLEDLKKLLAGSNTSDQVRQVLRSSLSDKEKIDAYINSSLKVAQKFLSDHAQEDVVTQLYSKLLEKDLGKRKKAIELLDVLNYQDLSWIKSIILSLRMKIPEQPEYRAYIKEEQVAKFLPAAIEFHNDGFDFEINVIPEHTITVNRGPVVDYEKTDYISNYGGNEAGREARTYAIFEDGSRQLIYEYSDYMKEEKSYDIETTREEIIPAKIEIVRGRRKKIAHNPH